MGWRKSIFYILILLFSSTTTLWANETEKKVTTTYPVASAILMDSYRYLETLKSFSFDAVTTNESMYRNLMLREVSHEINIDLKRPDKLHIHVEGDIKNRSFYLSNDTFSMIDHKPNFYTQLKTPKSIDGTLDYLFEYFSIKTALANLLYTDLDTRLIPRQKGYYFGTVKLGDTLCHHIGFSNKKRAFQVWIEKSDTPLIRKFVIIDKNMKFDPRSTTTINWNLEPHLKDEHFLFTAPKEAQQISIAPAS